MSIQIVEAVVKCQVPQMDSEEYVIRLRSGERVVSVPDGLTCLDAFDTYERPDADSTIICARYRSVREASWAPRFPR